jgi:hypothetical protein
MALSGQDIVVVPERTGFDLGRELRPEEFKISVEPCIEDADLGRLRPVGGRVLPSIGPRDPHTLRDDLLLERLEGRPDAPDKRIVGQNGQGRNRDESLDETAVLGFDPAAEPGDAIPDDDRRPGQGPGVGGTNFDNDPDRAVPDV